MADYDFTSCLSSLDFELLSKDLLEAELGIHLENFREGRDKGIDLRYSPVLLASGGVFNSSKLQPSNETANLIVQCKRYSNFANLKSDLKNKELAKIIKLNPDRYILTTSVSLSPQQSDELKSILSPFIQSTEDIYGSERLNSILTKHPEVERRHIKLWVSSAGVLNSIINAGTHLVSREEIERTVAAAKIYVRNESFDEALTILKEHRVCIISGLPGIGKTTLARMLLLYFYQRNFDIVKIESDISEARAVGYHNKPRFYYYDDFLGQTAQADKLNKNEDQKLLDFMASVRGTNDSVFVLTTREYILNQAKLHYEKLAREKFDHRTCVIDLAKYSRRIRAQILYNHLHFSDLPRPHLDALVDQRGYVRIVDHKNYNPRLIQYLTSLTWIGAIPSAEYLALFLRSLDNPVEIWDHAFRNQLSVGARHLLFVLTTMPVESIMVDVKQAFTTFHNSQCTRLNIAQSTTDFMNALKELDGTFASTRKIQDYMLVRFQNPSIRDYMQNILLSGELLPEVIDSLVFFEQAQWFVETLNDKQPRVPLKQLDSYASNVVVAAQRLFDANSCSFDVTGTEEWQHIIAKKANPAKRLATVALAVSYKVGMDDGVWMDAKFSELATNIEDGKLSTARFVGAIETLENLGCLTSEAGKCLVLVLKHHSLTELSELNDYDTLASLISTLPQSFADSELEAVREAYSEFLEQYIAECDFSNPEEYREEASRIGEIGDLLRVDTNDSQDTLRSIADEIDEQRASEWDNYDDDDDRRGGGCYDICSDGELDSMFATLAN